MFTKNIRTIYLYLICLITLFMVIGGLIATIYAVSEYVFPNNYSNYYYDYKDTTDNNDVSLDNYKKYVEIQKYQEEQNNINRKREDIKEIIYAASICVVALPVYLYNWRKIENEKASVKETESDGE